MKKMMLAVCLLLLGTGVSGCYKFVAEHPEKTEKEFYSDRALCEQKAREYVFERRQEVTAHDELDHARRCMEGLGWEYRFRKVGESEDSGTE